MGHVGHFKPTHMFHPSSGTPLDAYTRPEQCPPYCNSPDGSTEELDDWQSRPRCTKEQSQ